MTQAVLATLTVAMFQWRASRNPRPGKAERGTPSKFSLSASALRDQQQFSGNLPRFHVAMRLRCLR